MRHQAKQYLAKHQFIEIPETGPPHPALGLCVVIPCYDEPDLISTLDSLRWCESPRGVRTEVIVIVNAPQDAAPEVLQSNASTMQQAERWVTAQSASDLRFRFFELCLPTPGAGVGLARKIGMDHAIARFAETPRGRGVILSLDADCTVAPGYLIEVEQFFARHNACTVASIGFEHPVEPGDQLAAARHAIGYELHLRYYRQALLHAGFPHAVHAIGSCIAVRSESYAASGGMNRRQAGEDFYFLHKLMQAGRFGEITTTMVYPSARQSTRVPFGTGQSLARLAAASDEVMQSYAPEIFLQLKTLFDNLDRLSEEPLEAVLHRLAPQLAEHLQSIGLTSRVAEIRANTASPTSFAKRFYAWFDALEVLKYVHVATRNAHPRLPVGQAARRLLGWMNKDASKGLSDRELLEVFRRLDRD